MNIKSIVLSILVLIFSTCISLAQNTVKIGYTNPEYIVSQMPEYKQIESDLKTYEKQLQAQLDAKLKDYQAKLEDYQKNMSTYPDIVKQDKEKELINLQNNIKEFEENAMSSMQKKQGTLLDPLLDKIQKAIDAVAAENGYTYIFNSASTNNTAIILFAKNEDDNISDLVLKKLGITAPKPNTTGTTNPTTPTNTGTNTNTNTGSNTSTAPIKKK